ncbi:MAG: imidazole glycerol phosphate synthase subunit HisF [Candidatus Bathyarchaeota archaeon]|jgi:cyclase|nr:imidazole glycerol phosphate synthase subunit HisF [Candidatus Bathyarchaeota archaeon]MDP7207847.1 imidazole glycerol phosphate synthase subunit HisF [Candidatus Bathyarchaeota archaeon]MDP7442802.1 imidazole glycerol phosphate synthase subunit HisF [Candidatus Bathyarchaeota archaeon]
MLAKRIIPCLDVKEGRVVKGTHFIDLKDAGDPVELAKLYNRDGADELVFLDIAASIEGRGTLSRLVRSVATELDIPFTVGGGIRTKEDVRDILRNGADKTSLNTAAVEHPEQITEISELFGSQCTVVAIDVRRRYEERGDQTMVQTPEGPCWFEVYTYGGRKATGMDALRWAVRAEDLGAGELLVTSMDRDGTKTGFDNILYNELSCTVGVPIVASGGAGDPRHFLKAFIEGKADAALAASVFHYGNYPVPVVKEYLRTEGVEIRK